MFHKANRKIAKNQETRVQHARRAISGWMGRAVRVTKANPGRSILGALGAVAIGFAVAKVARIV